MDRRRDSFWFVVALAGASLESVDAFAPGGGGRRGGQLSERRRPSELPQGTKTAPNRTVLVSVSTHQISAKNMKINGLFQCGMLLLPVSFGQFGTSSVDLCSTLLLGLSKGGVVGKNRCV